MASLPASPRGGVFPSYSRRDTEEHEEQGEEIWQKEKAGNSTLQQGDAGIPELN